MSFYFGILDLLSGRHVYDGILLPRKERLDYLTFLSRLLHLLSVYPRQRRSVCAGPSERHQNVPPAHLIIIQVFDLSYLSQFPSLSSSLFDSPRSPASTVRVGPCVFSPGIVRRDLTIFTSG